MACKVCRWTTIKFTIWQTSQVSVACLKLATSLGQSFETGTLNLALPDPPDPLTLAGLGS